MIIGAHVILYSNDAEADRAFIRDTLGFGGVDAGDGWLIFGLPGAELAIHPTDGDSSHELYLMCNDIETQVQQLRADGVEITQEIVDRGWGVLASFRLPGGSELSVYEPRHPVAF